MFCINIWSMILFIWHGLVYTPHIHDFGYHSYTFQEILMIFAVVTISTPFWSYHFSWIPHSCTLVLQAFSFCWGNIANTQRVPRYIATWCKIWGDFYIKSQSGCWLCFWNDLQWWIQILYNTPDNTHLLHAQNFGMKISSAIGDLPSLLV